MSHGSSTTSVTAIAPLISSTSAHIGWLARCDFYVPKESSKAQSIEAKANLLRLRQEIPLNEDELRAVMDGITGREKLVAKLISCPTPDLH